MGGAVAAVILRKERELVEHFQREHATSPAAARSMTDLQIADDSSFRRLKNRAVLREASAGLFYLDEPSWIARSHRRRWIAAIALAAVVILFLAIEYRIIIFPS